MSYNVAILDAAERHLGLEEWPGSRQNPAIVGMFAEAGHSWVKDDETPWCAAFAAAVLAEVGLPHTGKLNARSYLDWGQPVQIADAKPGDVVVLWRNSPNSWTGHVAFLVRFDGSKAILRGGNQGNRVSDAAYPVSRILGVRRADGGASDDNRPVLRQGSRGRLVLDLQEALSDLGYQLGAADGVFGPATERAVLAFQKASGLAVDGIVGRRTWAALQSDDPARPRGRVVSERDLRDRGSQTISRQDKVQTGALATAGLGGAGGLAKLYGDLTTAQSAVESLPAGAGGGLEIWATAAVSIAVVAVGAYLWWQARQTKAARLRDAQTGAHMGR